MADYKVVIDVRSVQRAEKVVDRSFDKMTADIKKFSSTTQKELKKTNTTMNGFIKTVKAAALGYATVLATMEIQQFVKNTIQAGIELDSLERSFKAITGTMTEAGRELSFVNNIAKDMGLNLAALEGSYKDILAASKGTSLEGENVRKVFLAINKASAVLGMSADDTKGSLRALSQMISKGNVQAEELRGQLGERLPGAFQMAAEAMGVSTMKLNDMLENGEVLASDLLPRLAEILEKRYGSAAAKAGDRAAAAFENFRTTVLELQRAIGESGLTDFLALLARSATSVINILSDKQTTLSGLTAELERTRAALLATNKAMDPNRAELLHKRIASLSASIESMNRELGNVNWTDFSSGFDQEVYNRMLNFVQLSKDEISIINASTKAVEESRASYWKEEIEAMNDVIAKEKERFELARKAKLVGVEEQAEGYRKAAEAMRSMKGVDKAIEKANKALEKGLTPLDQYVNKLKESTKAINMLESITVSGIESMEDAFVELATTGKIEFGNLINSILADIVRLQVQKNITGPIAEGLSQMDWGGMFGSIFGSAKGNVVSGGSIHSSTNTILTQPTYFPDIKRMDTYATGGIAGEAGPELLAPVKRMPSGNMGIETSGLGANVNVYIQAPEGTQVKSQRQEKKGNGDTDLVIILDNINATLIGQPSKTQRALQTTFGIQNSLAGR